MRNFVSSLDFLGVLLDFVHGQLNSLVHTLLQLDGSHASCNSLQAFPNHGVCQNGGSSSSVTSNIVCLCGNFFQELGSHILVGIFQFNFPCNRYSVLCNGGSTEFLVQQHVASLGSQGNLYSLGNLLYTGQQFFAGIFIEKQLFCHFPKSPSDSHTPDFMVVWLLS